MVALGLDKQDSNLYQWKSVLELSENVDLTRMINLECQWQPYAESVGE